MGQYFDIVNLSKREKFSADAFDQNIKESGIGYGLQAHAIMLLLQTGSPIHPLLGSWRGDSVAIIGDYSGLYESLDLDAFKDIGREALNLIATCRFELLVRWIKESSYFESISEAAKTDPLIAKAISEASK